MAGSGTRSRENNSGAGGGVPVSLELANKLSSFQLPVTWK